MICEHAKKKAATFMCVDTNTFLSNESNKQSNFALLLALCGGLYISELMVLEFEDVGCVSDKLVVTIYKLKTDRTGQGFSSVTVANSVPS